MLPADAAGAADVVVAAVIVPEGEGVGQLVHPEDAPSRIDRDSFPDS